MIDPAATGAGAGANTQYAQDGLDQLTQVTDPRSLATAYTLDGLGNLTQQVSPDTGTTTNGSYDAAGNLKTSTDARNVVSTFTYDALDRITQAVYTPPVGSGMTTITLTYTYDGGTYGKGRLTGLTDPSGSTSYTYNQKGRLTQESRSISSVVYNTGYGYDSFGRLSSMTYPSGRVVTYMRDALGRVSQITTTPAGGSAQTVVSGVTYQPFGGIKGWTMGSGATYARTYDLDGRISSYTLATLMRTVGFDAASRIIGYTHTPATGNQSFGYDNLNRLTTWSTSSTNQSYGYDGVHNRTRVTYGSTNYSYTYPAGSNRLNTVAGPVAQTYVYDAAGNTKADGARTYTLDARGRMIQAVWGSNSATYTLNALGQRVVKTPNVGAATVFHYDSAGTLIAESNTAGTVSREYIYLNGTPVALVNASAPTVLYFIHPDHLDTARVITNNANAIVWRWDGADPFGSALANENPSGLGTFTFNPRFPGQYFDKETRLHYNYFRDYDPGTGRYVESDPIGIEGGLNTYSYVAGNPVNASDPEGLAIVCIPGGSCVVLPPIVGIPGSTGRPDKSGMSTGVPEIDNALSRSSGSSSTTEQCPPDEEACGKAKSDARRIYKDLTDKRIPQYFSGGTRGPDANHFVAILQKQSALRDAIRRIKLYCKPPPPELSEWEAVANQTIPKMH